MLISIKRVTHKGVKALGTGTNINCHELTAVNDDVSKNKPGAKKNPKNKAKQNDKLQPA